jgi:hypothetical protein
VLACLLSPNGRTVCGRPRGGWAAARTPPSR